MIGFFFHLIQDLDLLKPLLLECQQRGLATRSFVLQDIARKSPRLIEFLETNGFPYEIQVISRWPRLQKWIGNEWPRMSDIDVMLASAETNAKAHKMAHRTAQRCARKGIPFISFQHGLENLGLTYFDKEFPPNQVKFLSSHILTWGPNSTLHDEITADTLRRIVPIGCVKDFRNEPSSESVDLLDRIHKLYPQASPLRIVCIFENLHWGRYSDHYRNWVVQICNELPRQFPETLFIVKPHHAGRWLTKNPGLLKAEPNLVLADPTDKAWEPYTAPSLIQMADLVITTPSTVVLDSILEKKSVVLLDDAFPSLAYDGIPKVSNTTELFELMTSFLKDNGTAARLSEGASSYLSNKVLSLGAQGKIIDFVTSLKDFKTRRKILDSKVFFSSQQPRTSKNLCFYVGYSADGKIPEFAIKQIEYLQNHLKCDVFVCYTCDRLESPPPDHVTSSCARVIIRENIGYDFGSWRFCWEESLKSAESGFLILMNDSCYGPFSDVLDKIPEEGDRPVCFGFTESLRYQPHLQSYFRYFNGACLQTSLLPQYFESIVFDAPKEKLIEKFEVGLMPLLQKHKISARAWVSYPELLKKLDVVEAWQTPALKKPVNPSTVFWKQLQQKLDIPWVKRSSFRPQVHRPQAQPEDILIRNPDHLKFWQLMVDDIRVTGPKKENQL